MKLSGIYARSLKHRLGFMPAEDAFLVNEKTNLLVVADGVTRDPLENLPDTKTLLGKFKFAWNYERPSKAGIVARASLEEINYYSEEKGISSKGDIWFAIEKANQHIQEINHELGLTPESINYTTNNYAGCVLAVAKIDELERLVNWGFIADCGIAVINTTGDLKERTPDNGPDVHDKERWECLQLKDKEWSHGEARRFIHSTFVNKPLQEYSYGTLTGEKEAMSYVQTGTYELKENDHVLAYTDGASEILFKKDGDISGTTATLISNKDWTSLEKILKTRVHSEGTLVYSKK